MWSPDFFSTIELNITELCNMSCVFCPRAFDYPNQNLHMSEDIAELIVTQLDMLPNIDRIYFAGRGEPTLHTNFDHLAQKFIDYRNKHRPSMRIQIATNGSRVDRYQDQLKQFHQVRYSIYDESKISFNEAVKKYQSWNNVIVHDKRSITLNSDLKPNTYHNRAGSAPHPITRTVNLAHNKYGMICEKPLNVIYISWNGDYNLCCNDWEDIQVLGNIKTETLREFVTNNSKLQEYQQQMLAGTRNVDPCSTCNRPVHPRWLNFFAAEVDKIRNK